MKFKDIPQLTRDGSYQANIPMRYILDKIKEWEEDDYYQLQLNPKFQRGHVWTEEQQIAYVEFLLRGGKSAKVIYFNKPSWNICSSFGYEYDDFVCVDGLLHMAHPIGWVCGAKRPQCEAERSVSLCLMSQSPR